MSELRSLFAVQVTRGGLLRADGVGVGLVLGGAPPWELIAPSARSQAGADFHRMLLALDSPLDIYLYDQPHDTAGFVEGLLRRQDSALEEGRAVHAAVLGEMAEYLAALGRHSASRAKAVVWAVTAGAPHALGAAARVSLGALLRAGVGEGGLRATAAGQGGAALSEAVERARRLADALGALGGPSPARLPEPEEIAALLYRHADPVRAQRYPLHGALLGRVQRVVGASEPWPAASSGDVP